MISDIKKNNSDDDVSIQEVINEIKHPSQQPIQHPPQQPIHHPPQQPIHHPPQQPIHYPPQQPIQHPPQQPIQHPPQQLIQHPPQQPIQHFPQQPIQQIDLKKAKSILPLFSEYNSILFFTGIYIIYGYIDVNKILKFERLSQIPYLLKILEGFIFSIIVLLLKPFINY